MEPSLRYPRAGRRGGRPGVTKSTDPHNITDNDCLWQAIRHADNRHSSRFEGLEIAGEARAADLRRSEVGIDLEGHVGHAAARIVDHEPARQGKAVAKTLTPALYRLKRENEFVLGSKPPADSKHGRVDSGQTGTTRVASAAVVWCRRREFGARWPDSRATQSD